MAIRPHDSYFTFSVFLLQKKIMLIATCSGYFAHTEPIFKNLNLLKLEDIYKLKVLKFYFNLIKGNLPSKFDVFCFIII